MEQPCYKCGQTVEQGRPFCPHCAAPQIRVLISEPVSASLGAIAPTESSDQLTLPRVTPLLPLQWSQVVKPATIAALIAAAGMVLKLVAPLIAAIGAGFLGVAIYRRQNPLVKMSAAVGARIGAICGFFTFCLTAIFGAVRVAILGEGGAIRQTMLDAVQQQAWRYSDPQLQPALEFMRSNAGLAFMLVLLGIFGLILFALLGILGGAIGGASFSTRER